MLSARDVKFWVKVLTEPPEKVFVCGSLPELGRWETNNSQELNQLEGKDEWQLEMKAKFDESFSFRYFVGVVLTSPEAIGGLKKHIVIKRWETSLCSRKRGAQQAVELDTFGAYSSSETTLKPEKPMIGLGCLRTVNCVQIMVKPDALSWWKAEGTRDLAYRVAAINRDGSQVDNCSNIEIAVLNDYENAFRAQDDHGRAYDPFEFVIFNFYTIDPQKIAVQFHFNSWKSSLPLASSVLVLQETHQNIEIPIFENMAPVGYLKVSYLVIKPLKSHTFDFCADYTKFTATMQSGVHVGHKGAGNRRRNDTPERVLENTIASLNYAADHGADMVEFDVVLTRDKIPVLYHDFVVNVSLNKRGSKDLELFALEIKNLTYHQLQHLKVGPVSVDGHPTFEFVDNDGINNQPFPKLETVLKTVNPVAFNLEIKYPTNKDEGVDPNEYVDTILKTVFDHAGFDRDIVISCFDPDICTLLRMKQNTYPVSFLTRGTSNKSQMLKDLRMDTVEMGTYFALCMSLTGIHCHAEAIIKELHLVRFVISRGLILFCWGDDINACSVIEHLAKEGVHGLIYDNIDKLCPKARSNDGNNIKRSKSRS